MLCFYYRYLRARNIAVINYYETFIEKKHGSVTTAIFFLQIFIMPNGKNFQENMQSAFLIKNSSSYDPEAVYQRETLSIH